jgi:hypothetical protein
MFKYWPRWTLPVLCLHLCIGFSLQQAKSPWEWPYNIAVIIAGVAWYRREKRKIKRQAALWRAHVEGHNKIMGMDLSPGERMRLLDENKADYLRRGGEPRY